MQENEADAVAIAMPHRPQNPLYCGYNCNFGPQFKTMSSSSNSYYMNNKQDVYGNESTYITNEQFIDFFDGLEEDYNTNSNIEFYNSSSVQIDDITSGFESCLTEKDESMMTQTTTSDEREEDIEENIDLSFQQHFHFLDNVNDVAMNYYSPFDIEEHVELEMNDDDESSMLRNAMKRMKYERKISASLYAFNGIPECLKLKLESENKAIEFSNELTNLKKACNKNKIDA
jgi:EREBP-like factor